MADAHSRPKRPWPGLARLAIPRVPVVHRPGVLCSLSLPFPLIRARTSLSPVLYKVPSARRRCWSGWRAVGEQRNFGANHRGNMNLMRRFNAECAAESVPLVVGGQCPITFHSQLRGRPRTACDGQGAIPPERPSLFRSGAPERLRAPGLWLHLSPSDVP
jgi:hypothetical protein